MSRAIRDLVFVQFHLMCGVEMWRGGLGAAYLLPALSSAGASIAAPYFRFHIPLIEPDERISRFRDRKSVV